MKKIEMKLHSMLFHEGIGHCQVTYSSRNTTGQRLVYCLQYQGENWNPKVRLMRCSQDGEPSHEVKFTKVRAVFERPTGETKTEKAAREWIDVYEGVPW